MKNVSRLVLACLCVALGGARAPVEAQPAPVRASVYVQGLSQPLAFVQDPSTPRAQYVVQQDGRIRVVLDGVAAPERLTAREQEVLALIARAWSNRQIEDALGIQKSTVKRHVRHILRKLHARNRVQAAVLAYRATHLPQEGATG